MEGAAFYDVLRKEKVEYRRRGVLGKLGLKESVIKTITERVEVDEGGIDSIEDSELRDSLRRQVRLRATDANRSLFIWANPDHTFHHAYHLPVRALNVEFTADGVIDHQNE